MTCNDYHDAEQLEQHEHKKMAQSVRRTKMEQQKAGTPPQYKGDGVAVWVNKDKNGKTYLSIQLLGKNGIKVHAFKNEPKVRVDDHEV